MSPPREISEVHECNWCLQECACEPANTGSGHLWICGGCATRVLGAVGAVEAVEGGERPKHRAKSSAPVMVPVKRIGRDAKRCYCEKCGQKRRVCQCEEEAS
jgi:hypothetical protein